VLRRIACMLGLHLAVILGAGGSGVASAAVAADAAPAATSLDPPPAESRQAGAQRTDGENGGAPASWKASPLDRRVALLARELGLDATQSIKVKAVLEAQREQVARIWSEAAVPSAVRIGRTQAVGDHTADQIRALLNDEQRKKYIQPRQRDVAVGTTGSDVQSWMKTGQQPKAAP
jgi:hypothetical protein